MTNQQHPWQGPDNADLHAQANAAIDFQARLNAQILPSVESLVTTVGRLELALVQLGDRLSSVYQYVPLAVGAMLPGATAVQEFNITTGMEEARAVDAIMAWARGDASGVFAVTLEWLGIPVPISFNLAAGEFVNIPVWLPIQYAPAKLTVTAGLSSGGVVAAILRTARYG